MPATRTSSREENDRGALAEALPAYEIGEVLGRGSFATVYAARHIRLNREVAIKHLSPDLLLDPKAGERFAAEARALALLDHPHVVRVHDYVEHEHVYALIMERLRGGTLADRLRYGHVPQPSGCAFAVATLHGLEHAHQHGILHRDIKPANLLFAERNLVKVGDFGIAKVVGAGAAQMTATGLVLGTPAFMAPEQASRSVGPVTPATDVWAVGTLLYHLLSGQLPYDEGDDVIEVLNRRVVEDARPLGTVAPDVPQEIADVVMHALTRDPAVRWATAGAFAEAIEAASERAFADGLGTTGVPIHRTQSRPAGAEQPTVAEPATVALASQQRRTAPVRPPSGSLPRGWRPTRTIALIAAAVAVLAAGAALALLGRDGARPQTTVPTTAAAGSAATAPAGGGAAQGRAALQLPRIIARPVRLDGQAVLAGWEVRNPTQVEAKNVVTCAQLPKGFRISYQEVNRPREVTITGRKACITLGSLFADSSAETLVEGYAPPTAGNYRITLTVTAGNATAVAKTVTLRVVER